MMQKLNPLCEYQIYRIYSWALSYLQKFSDLRNFQKKSENFKPNIFVRKVRKII
jgi:hypothetical protein